MNEDQKKEQENKNQNLLDENQEGDLVNKGYSNLLTVGIVGFDDMKYLWQLFKSITKTPQGIENFRILFLENGDNQGTAEFVRENFPQVEVFVEEKSLGVSGGHNFLIQKSDSKYYFCLNSDLLVGENTLKNLLDTIESNEKIAAVAPLLLKWDYHNHEKHNLTDTVDSAGLEIHKNQTIKRRGFKENKSKFNKQENIWGFSDSAAMLRRDALESTKHAEGEYFDNNFFVGKQSIDLSYRLRWAGWDILLEPKAEVWHDSSGNSREKTKEARIENYKNHYLFLQKNFAPFAKDFSPEVKKGFYTSETKRALGAFLKNPRVFLKGFSSSKALWPDMMKKASGMPKVISSADMEKWFL